MRTFLHLILALSILVGLVLFGFPVSAASQINPETGINIVRAPGDPVTVTLTSTPEGSFLSTTVTLYRRDRQGVHCP